MQLVLQFKSIGKPHNDEAGFFKFLVNQRFNDEGSRVLQWCKIAGLTVTIEALTDDVIKWGWETLRQDIETPTGYKYALTESNLTK